MKKRHTPVLLAALLGAAVAGCGGHAAEETSAGAAVPLYDDLGSWHREIATDSERAQAYFDQGLRLQYAFNHAEAIRSYRAALDLDPECAMCWWGIALAAGPNINAPMDSASGALAREAIGRARELAAEGPPGERALIEALAVRYADDPTAERAPLDSAWARAIGRVAEARPDDPDVLTLRAAALMNLSPWNYWTGPYDAREPRPDTPAILAAVERVLEIEPDHPGACHYFIHAVEAAYPERAVPCAERLASLMPGAGHIVHMPGHIYIRVGRYHDAVRANEHAVHADESYIQDQRPGGIYPGAYYPHNYHFMWFAATMAGMRDKALWAARQVAPKVPLELAREVYWIQNVRVLPRLAMVTFGDWEGVLAEPMPSPDLPVATVMAHYARGVARAATGRPEEARSELATLRGILAEMEADQAPEGIRTVSGIAVKVLEGEIALRSGDPEGAVPPLREAAALEDGLLYEEPPLWYLPVRHVLGRALLEAGRPAEAEQVYRQDLVRFPANGWSLVGLTAALEAQGRRAATAEARASFEEAWRHADIELTSSRI
ncbi:MAG: tetratricopeptide repeat protein [Gemmatimonadota bacterium]|nr:tetratricopeptide repeat protein [Gemmatimonadota bacterium]